MNARPLVEYFDRISEAPEAVPRLRRFILDLAVRGRLVEPDPRDEPAAELLRRIEREKARLVKAGEIRKLDTFTPVEPAEIPFAVPSGWGAVRMGWLARKLGAGSTPLGGKSVYQDKGVPFLRSQNVYNDGLKLDDVALISRATHERMSGTHVQQRDILLNITGASIGRCALVSEALAEGNVSQHVAIVRLFDPSIREFIHLSLTSPLFQAVIDEAQVGVSREGLSMQRLRLFPMLLPPLAEQLRIVAKVDELMALCDRLEAAQSEREFRRDAVVAASLDRLNHSTDDESVRATAGFYLDCLPRLTIRQDQIPALRQTILNLAVRGRLVSQSSEDEPASTLLRDRQLLLDSDAEPWKLPRGWAWSCYEKIGQTIGGGTPSKDVAELWDGNIPWVSPKDMKVDFVGGARDHISELALAQSAAKLIPAGSLLMVVRGMILAHSFPTAIATVSVTINQDMKAVVPFRSDLDKTLLLISKGMKSEVLRLVLRSTHGTCKLLTDDLFSLPLPIPPLAEQARILARVDELMAICDKLESCLEIGRSDNARLLDTVLCDALAANTSRREDGIRTPLALPATGRESGTNQSDSPQGLVETQAVPYVGAIAAGVLTLAEQRIEDWFHIPRSVVKPSDDAWCVLRVKGNSMNLATIDDRRIEDGDFVLVRRQDSPAAGKIVVAECEGDAVLKRYVKTAKGAILKAESTDSYPDIAVGPAFRIQGVVRANLKSGSAFKRTDEKDS